MVVLSQKEQRKIQKMKFTKCKTRQPGVVKHLLNRERRRGIRFGIRKGEKRWKARLVKKSRFKAETPKERKFPHNQKLNRSRERAEPNINWHCKGPFQKNRVDKNDVFSAG